MLRNHIVYIIGFMGSGKSTAGKKLASRLGWSFIDLDKIIEERSGMSIPELFSKYGEEYFRDLETEALKSFKSNTDTIIATGGGTPCHGDNMEYMLETGLTIYLQMTPDQLKIRLVDAKGDRPLIKGLNPEELLSFIQEKLASREKWYNNAEIILNSMSLDFNLLYSLVMSRLKI